MIQTDQFSKGWIIGITGASGSIYGIRLCSVLLSMGFKLHLIITDAGWRVIHDELEWNVAKRKETLEEHFGSLAGEYIYYSIQDIGASIASGSFRTEGMVIIPCSMGTLSGIANGASNNLLKRAADVMLKEERKLIIIPRETPLHRIHLEHMLKLSSMGASIVPAMPGFYNKPKTIDDLVNFQVGKVLDLMKIDHQLFKRWGEEDA